MEYLSITGGRKLSGTVYISGSKNAAVALLPASVASGGVCVLDNLPKIRDVHILVDAIKTLGVKCTFINDHTLEIDSREVNSHTITYDKVKDMRASYYMLGALLGRFKRAVVPMPGGCNFVSRPIDLHIKGFEALGARTIEEHGTITVHSDKLVGANIYMDSVSVGATINIMLAAVYAEGVTQIENAAKEPHVVDTANFLNKLGAKITGAGTDTIRINGVGELHGTEYSVVPDQIEAGTFMVAAAITGGDIVIDNIIPKHLESPISKLREMGCIIEERDASLRIRREGELKPSNVKTMAYPGFPTDLQPPMTVLLCCANGTSTLTEMIWEHRFQYLSELQRLGVNFKQDGRMVVVHGSESALTGAQVKATDLRAGAALVVAGLAAEGETLIGNVKYLDRGYECIEEKLLGLGADVKRVEIDEPVNGA